MLRQKAEKAKGGAPAAATTFSWDEQKRLKNRKKQLPGLRDKVLAAIDAAELRSKLLKEQWGDPSFYLRTPPAELKKLELEERELVKRVEQLTHEWEALESELQSLADA